MTNATIPEVKSLTQEQIDFMGETHATLAAEAAKADMELGAIETEIILRIQQFGQVPAHAENSRVLRGRFWELMAILRNTTQLDPARVKDVQDALEANGYGHIFQNLFAVRTRYELVKDADKAILAAGMPKRLTDKIETLYGRCFQVKQQSPALKVKKIVEKPAKKPRGKKAQAPAAESAKAEEQSNG